MQVRARPAGARRREECDRSEARCARWWAELQIEPSDSWCYFSATSFRFRFDATGDRAYGLPPVHFEIGIVEPIVPRLRPF
jgi:hypothetical protein